MYFVLLAWRPLTAANFVIWPEDRTVGPYKNWAGWQPNICGDEAEPMSGLKAYAKASYCPHARDATGIQFKVNFDMFAACF